MPQHKSCEKRLRQDAKRTARNRAERGHLRTSVRKYRELDTAQRPQEYASLQSLLDKAVKKGIISKNRAARLKSRLSPAV
ncbi:MAG TPA: 30S ribosomal protein S20 [Candidatus Krumholzibacteria bacterium]|nr:30S ribosomal protein S20 [Candidatus Krumholzibacteria bacterium]